MGNANVYRRPVGPCQRKIQCRAARRFAAGSLMVLT